MADISREEYEKYMALRDEIAKGIENAQSEFMLTTYSMLHATMRKRLKAALALNIQLENREISQKRQEKREQLRSAKSSD
ncbi:MAG: hypothetical protein AUG51_16140 [Acidobacteria bacterium 13_1_20CM_3_53_8]|nr:MAG: hypothetical protein AUG51_16140 [Acidobacteria bacterium 13_1_20CM_3_53_8]